MIKNLKKLIKLKKQALILLVFIISTNALFSQVTILSKQKKARSSFYELVDYMGSDNAAVLQNDILLDPKSSALFLRFEVKLKEVMSEGVRYNNVLFKGDIPFNVVNSVYIEGEKVVLDVNSQGYVNQVKVPGEYWTEAIQRYSDFTITVYNSQKREEIAKVLQFFVDNPYISKD